MDPEAYALCPIIIRGEKKKKTLKISWFIYSPKYLLNIYNSAPNCLLLSYVKK